MANWKSADEPPRSTPGKWSFEKIVITNRGRVFKSSYFVPSDELLNGCWQHKDGMDSTEEPVLWIEFPVAELKKLGITDEH